MILTDLSPSDIEPKLPSPSGTLDRDRQATRACVAPPARGEASLQSSTTPGELFSRWLDFIHITDGANGEPVSCRLTLLGVIDGACLMVTSTTLERDWSAMQPGRRLHATVFDGRRVYTFDTAVTSRFAAPFRYLHLAYPAKLDERTPRRTSRLPVSLEAVLTYEVDGAPTSAHATITNLSAMSAGLRTSDLRLAVGTPLRLAFTLLTNGGETVPIRVSAIVRRHEIAASTASATCGLEFVDVPAHVRAQLDAYLACSAGTHSDLAAAVTPPNSL